MRMAIDLGSKTLIMKMQNLMRNSNLALHTNEIMNHDINLRQVLAAISKKKFVGKKNLKT